jgi:hypothetical protein
MPTSRSKTTTGLILVGIGMLCEIAAYWEQPDLVQFSPNRFYNAADLSELEAAHQAWNDLQTGRDLLAQASPSGGEQGAAEVKQQDASTSPDRAALIAAAEAKHTALQQKQDRAFRNQGIVSQTLKWVGIALLVGAAVFLTRTGKTAQATAANIASDQAPGYRSSA